MVQCENPAGSHGNRLASGHLAILARNASGSYPSLPERGAALNAEQTAAMLLSSSVVNAAEGWEDQNSPAAILINTHVAGFELVVQLSDLALRCRHVDLLEVQESFDR